MFDNFRIRSATLAFLLLTANAMPKCAYGSSIFDHCTSIKIRTAMSVLSFTFSAGAFIWVHQENRLIEKLTREAEEAKLRVNQLTQSISSLSNCIGELVEEHKETDKVSVLMSLEHHARKHNALPIFFQYSDPTTYLFRHSKSLSSARLDPQEVKFIQFNDCKQIHSFFDATYDVFLEARSTTLGFEPDLLFDIFDLSLAFCGGYLNDNTFSSEHPCYVIAQGFLKLSPPENKNRLKHSANKILAHINSQNKTLIHLPVMGTKQITDRQVYTYHTHKVWLESFFINNLLKISRIITDRKHQPPDAVISSAVKHDDQIANTTHHHIHK